MAATSENGKTSELLRKRIEAKRDLDKKSLESVEALLEKNISESQLLEHCNNLWQQSYQDCTEERALAELCGYPVCDNPVASQNLKMPKYKICVRSKKVYSTEKHRIFCSLRCAENSEWLKSQLSELPLWMVEAPYRRKINLREDDRNIPKGGNLDGNLLPEPEKISAKEIEHLSQSVDRVSLRDGTQHAPIPRTEPVPRREEMTAPEIFTVEKLEKLLCEWFTIASLHHIVGEDRFLELRAQYDQGVTAPGRHPDDRMADYIRLNAFLAQQEKLEGITYEDEDEDMGAAKESSLEKPERNVPCRPTRKRKVGFKSAGKNCQSRESSGDLKLPESSHTSEPVLPHVDRHQQRLIREQILLDRISPLVATASSLMQTPAHTLARDISQLLRTFDLTHENCLVRHNEIAVVFALIMMLLDRKAGGEGQMSKDVRLALDAPLKKAGLGWGDICVALQKATDPRRLFQCPVDRPV
ncbi:uncharacterized protein LOC100902359 [Galendromus occidentalis]|uniref:RNA polymerase II subunit B1 CTD phosphatase RPAP2 homolog n=1 Tax=Galendromus occidentalis TaxID=34638 RepID=A0AAJ6VYI3_9ACAR|nr:uncharacterized protein LOC100902359 [Galendromus occidentalis]